MLRHVSTAITAAGLATLLTSPSHAANPEQNASALAKRVARSGTSTTLTTQHRCLARAVYAEAKSEPLVGQLAVAQVIVNRMNTNGRFPRTVCGVVHQPGQFADLRNLAIDYSAAQWKRAVGIAHIAMSNGWRQVTDNALYFHATYVSPRWRFTRVATIGKHIFYR